MSEPEVVTPTQSPHRWALDGWNSPSALDAGMALAFARLHPGDHGPELCEWFRGNERFSSIAFEYVRLRLRVWMQRNRIEASDEAVAAACCDGMHDVIRKPAPKSTERARHFSMRKTTYLRLRRTAERYLSLGILSASSRYLAAWEQQEPGPPSSRQTQTMDSLKLLNDGIAGFRASVDELRLRVIENIEAEFGRVGERSTWLRHVDINASYALGTLANFRNGLIRATRQTDPVASSDDLAAAGWEVLVSDFYHAAIRREAGQIVFTFRMTDGATTEMPLPLPDDPNHLETWGRMAVAVIEAMAGGPCVGESIGMNHE